MTRPNLLQECKPPSLQLAEPGSTTRTNLLHLVGADIVAAHNEDLGVLLDEAEELLEVLRLPLRLRHLDVFEGWGFKEYLQGVRAGARQSQSSGRDAIGVQRRLHLARRRHV